MCHGQFLTNVSEARPSCKASRSFFFWRRFVVCIAWPEGPQHISPGQSRTTSVVERRPGQPIKTPSALRGNAVKHFLSVESRVSRSQALPGDRTAMEALPQLSRQSLQIQPVPRQSLGTRMLHSVACRGDTAVISPLQGFVSSHFPTQGDGNARIASALG